MAIVIAHIYIGSLGMEGVGRHGVGRGGRGLGAPTSSIVVGRYGGAGGTDARRSGEHAGGNTVLMLHVAWASRLAAVSMMLCLACSPVSAGEFYTLKGHGGPVMDIRLSPAGTEIATAGFDNAVGLWRRRQSRWLDGHDAAVNVVAFIDARRLASAGDDFAVILWPLAGGAPNRRLTGHAGKVVDFGGGTGPILARFGQLGWPGRAMAACRWGADLS